MQSPIQGSKVERFGDVSSCLALQGSRLAVRNETATVGWAGVAATTRGEEVVRSSINLRYLLPVTGTSRGHSMSPRAMSEPNPNKGCQQESNPLANLVCVFWPFSNSSICKNATLAAITPLYIFIQMIAKVSSSRNQICH